MRKRIEQLLNGKFEYEKKPLVLLPEDLKLEIEPGEAVRGSFWIESPDDEKVRGFLYSSNPRMLCEPTDFFGTKIEIRYQADGSGFPEGTSEEGYFTICCERGEYRLPYTLSAEKKEEKAEEKTEQTSLPWSTPEEIASAAQKDFQQAYRGFISKAYRALLAKKLPEQLGLYDALAVSSAGYQNLEEFLCGAGFKEAVVLSVDQEVRSFSPISESVGEVIRLEKSAWGFQKISVTSDAPFLRPERKVITTDEFTGSTYELKFVINHTNMHAGRNYGRITFATPYQRLRVEVTAVRAENSLSGRENRVCRSLQKKLENLYISFRLKRIGLSAWTERSIGVVNSYLAAGGSDPFAELFLMQLYYADGKRQKAAKLMEKLEAEKERLDTPERYGFYLYLTTFFYREAAYVDRVEEEIRSLLQQNPSNWRLQWILLYLQESLLKDSKAKYEAVEEQFRRGCRSPIMYLEAYQLLQEEPFLMRHPGSFELQLLRFASREGVLSAEILQQAAGLASRYGKYSALLFEVLKDGCQRYPSTELIRAVCLLLMKGERRDAEAFFWYEKGVNAGLRITGLYEYYMESVEHPDLTRMPQVIRMYFAYDTALDYRKRAAIYRSIAESKEQDPETYRMHRAAMEKFTLEQLEMGRMTEDLGVLYRRFLKRNLLTRGMAEHLAEFLFSYEITSELPDMQSVTVHSTRLIREYSAVFTEGRARIAVYDPDSVLLLENREGERFAAKGRIRKKKLFEADEMLEWCMQLSPEFPGTVLFACTSCMREHLVNRNTLPYLRSGCEQESFESDFRNALRKEVLLYYASYTREESLPEFLEKITYLDYVRADKAALITLLAEEGCCSDAFSLLDMYGAEGIPDLQLVRICSRMVLDLEFAENPMLLSLCRLCFTREKYNDKLLRYLLLYYEGPIREMIQVWEAARSYELDTMLLEEKILMMILFTGSGSEGSEPVFESYARKMGRKKICRAYLNLKSYEYFVCGLPAAECVFRFIERDYERLSDQGQTEEQEEVCRLALLQHYSSLVSLSEKQRRMVSGLLEEFDGRGMRFAFWEKFDPSLVKGYQMEGHVFAEYVGNPKSTVTICYRRYGSEEPYVRETVKNCFEGIFVREFILFEDDKLECYLEEDNGTSQKKSDPRILTWNKTESARDSSRYGLINRTVHAECGQNPEAAWAEADNYLLLDYLAEELFTLM